MVEQLHNEQQSQDEPETCGNCGFMREVRDPSQLGRTATQCFRHPPQQVVIPQRGGIGVVSMHPGVAPDTPACGEHLDVRLSPLEEAVLKGIN